MGGMYVIKVLLVDDEQYIREGLRQLVDWEEYGYEIIGEAGNGVDAIAILEESQVDVVFVDIRMPKMTGLELIEYVQEKLLRNITVCNFNRICRILNMPEWQSVCSKKLYVKTDPERRIIRYPP